MPAEEIETAPHPLDMPQADPELEADRRRITSWRDKMDGRRARFPLVAVESPLRGRVPRWVPTLLAPLWERVGRLKNKRYALLCMRDSLARGEAPYASHLLFDRAGLLDDAQSKHRQLGMDVGQAWTASAELLALYTDYGISDGMMASALNAAPHQRIEFRLLYDHTEPRIVQQILQARRRIDRERPQPAEA